MVRLTLKRLRNTQFEKLYKRLLLGEPIGRDEASSLLSVAVVLLSEGDIVLRDMGYKIVLMYSLRTQQFVPLYEVSMMLGYTTIAAAISSLDSFEHPCGACASLEVDSLYMEFCTQNGKCLTAGQNRFRAFNADETIREGVVVAPTSYGKSEAICDLLTIDNLCNICIIVPTKSLVSQTRSMVSNCLDSAEAKLITHPGARYSLTGKNIFVLTQERLAKLLSMDRNLSFDCLIIDEAHNLLEDEARSRLLANVIILAKARNPRMLVRYLTPFLFSVESLQLRLSSSLLQGCSIDESLKMVRLMLFDKGLLYEYDQFYDSFYEQDNRYEEFLALELDKGSSFKNIIYLNRPICAEKHAKELAEQCSPVASDLVNRFCRDLGSFTHPDYNLISCARKGVLYHHGAMSETVRKGVEYLFSKEPQCKYLVTTSTLLEGVNLPATRMFILDVRKGIKNLSPANFRNLVGRVCRLGEIFGSAGQLDLLQPEVYIVRSPYMRKDANLSDYISQAFSANKKNSDQIENIALKNSKADDSAVAALEEHIENFEPGILENYAGRRVQTEIGRICFSNSTLDFDIIDVEKRIEDRLKNVPCPIDTTEELVRVISEVFIPEVTDDSLRRLREQEARNFYSTFLNWRIENVPLPQMIMSFVRYWLKRAQYVDGRYAYVGSRWGEEKREGHMELWVDVGKKNKAELVNLAIVRVQEEQEFVDNRLLKYMDVLHEYGLVDDSLRKRIRYGTTDDAIIQLLDNGFSYGLVKLLREAYRVDLAQLNENMEISSDTYNEMERNQENLFTLLEAQSFTRVR